MDTNMYWVHYDNGKYAPIVATDELEAWVWAHRGLNPNSGNSDDQKTGTR